MAFSDFEAARVSKLVGGFVEQRRPPVHLRPQVDLAFRISGQSVEIFELRPPWDDPSGKKVEHPIAKATYLRTTDDWRVSWMRSDMKWHSYEPMPFVETIEGFLDLVEKDEYCCFFG